MVMVAVIHLVIFGGGVGVRNGVGFGDGYFVVCSGGNRECGGCCYGGGGCGG
jgi:hypothetical protein